MRYLTAIDIVAIHNRVIEETGKGLPGLRDEHLLKSLVRRPQISFGDTEQFKTVFEKAAVLFESIATYHVFLDANKRTAVSATCVFLNANGYKTVLPIEESEAFIISLAQKQKTIQEIAAWLEARSRPI